MDDFIISKCLVVRTQDYYENDTLITVITEDYGRMTVSVKGGQSVKCRFNNVKELFTYSVMTFKKGRTHYYLSDCELIDNFYSLRKDLLKVALATYICDVASELSPEGITDKGILKLTLNTLYALANLDYCLPIVKAAFEFKACVLAGFMPELETCEVCGKDKFIPDFLDAENGGVICSECSDTKAAFDFPTGLQIKLSNTALYAMRYLCQCPIQKFLSFRIEEEETENFAVACEKYLLCHIEREYYSLKFYKTVTR